ncbi:MAG: DUF4153 domain-containing protein [Treponema sp.]|nr:DUF4153 domain-containing protein [Treponema sp.]
MGKFSIIKTKIKETLAEAVAHIAATKVIFISTLIAFVFACVDVCRPYEYGKNVSVWEDLYLAFFMAAVFAMSATLLTQKFTALKKYLIQGGVAVAGALLGFFSHRGFGNSVYSSLYYYGILCAAVLITLYLFIPKGNSRTYFSLVFKHALFCSFMTLVFMGGLLLLVYAVQNLILNTDNNDVYECSCFFCAFIFGVNTFTYYLFHRREDESSGKAFKVITLYILFPVFAVLILILYIYLLKALFLFKLPNGQINWFVSFASCFYIVFYFILREYDELPVIKFFYKFGAFVFIPLILIQIYAYFIRVNAYGFTGYRYSSLLFIIFSIITITLTFIKKGKYVNWAIIALTAIVLYDSVTPFNLINMAHKSQFSRMVKVMNKYDIYDEETDTLKLYDPDALEAAISDDDRAALYSAYKYILWTSHLPHPEWATKVEYDEDGQKHTKYLYFEEVFGIKTTRADEKILEFDKLFESKKIKNIEAYKEFVEITDSKWSSGSKNGEYVEYLKEMPEIAFYSKTGKKYCLEDFFFTIDQNVSEDEPLWYMPDDEIAFCFERIEYKYNTEKKLFRSYHYNGYVFYK